MSDAEVVVVGAGPAGLSCAALLQRAGVSTVVLERSNAVGVSWRRHYDRLRLNTSRWLSHLPGTRYPLRAGLFPSRDDVIRHLQAHARRYAIPIRFETQVDSVQRVDGQWVLHTSRGEVRAPHVVIATGLFGEPTIPRWPGRDRYQGTLIHSSEYRNPSTFAGLDVLVVGPGSSGMEIAQDLAEASVRSVRLSVRTPPNILLRSIGGLPGDPAALALLAAPPRVADWVVAAMRRVTVGNLSKYGLPPPHEGPFSKLRSEGTAPAVVDQGTLEAIRSGRVQIVAAVDSLDESGVRFADGSRIDVDAVIAATGYRPGLERMVGHLGVLDENGVPKRSDGGEAAPGLVFVGFRAVPGLFWDVARQSRRIAKSIARDVAVRRPGHG